MTATRILLVYDHPAWCFGHMARGIAKYAPDRYQVSVQDVQQFSKLTHAPEQLAKRFEAVCQFGLAEASSRLPIRNVGVVAHPGWFYSRERGGWLGLRLTTQIRCLEAAERIMPQFDRLLCFNASLTERARELNPDAVLALPGIDTELYRPTGWPESERLIVGWCGQKPSKGHRNQKGYGEILEPLMERMGDTVEWRINDRTAADALTQDEMVAWYNGLHVFLCTSIAEGGPLTVLEAMACGRAVESTPVGIWGEKHAPIGPYVVSRELVKSAIDYLEYELGNWRVSFAHQPGPVNGYRSDSVAGWRWEKRAAEWLDLIAGNETSRQ